MQGGRLCHWHKKVVLVFCSDQTELAIQAGRAFKVWTQEREMLTGKRERREGAMRVEATEKRI